jgi:Cdc6-like AAA superfamily ATPase
LVFNSIIHYIGTLDKYSTTARAFLIKPNNTREDDNDTEKLYLQPGSVVQVYPGIHMMFEEIREEILTNNDNKNFVERKEVIHIWSNTSLQHIEDFVKKCITLYDKHLQDSIKNNIYYIEYNTPNQTDAEGNDITFSMLKLDLSTNFSSLFFKEKDELITAIDQFEKNETNYRSRGIPYKLNILLHGDPGCGKTSIIKAISNHTRRSIISINLKEIKSYQELKNIVFGNSYNGWRIPNHKKILLFEDIDASNDVVLSRDVEKKLKTPKQEITVNIHGKDYPPITREDTLTLSHLLNIFDGVLETTSIITIITTNYKDRLDKALVRAGRINLELQLKKTDNEQIHNIIRHYCEDYSTPLPVFPNNKYTPADIVRICLSNNCVLKTVIKHII